MISDKQAKALIVANSAENLMAYNQALGKSFQTENSPTLDSTLDLLDDFEPDIVIIDQFIINADAKEICEAIHSDSISNSYLGTGYHRRPEMHDINTLRDIKCESLIHHSQVADQLLLSAQTALRIKDLENQKTATDLRN